MKKRLLFYLLLIMYVVFAVGLNTMSAYFKVAQTNSGQQSPWYVIPPLVLLFVGFSLWLRSLYHRSNPQNGQKVIVMLIGILILIIPVIPSVALHLDLPFSVPYLQFAGANLLLLPWFRNI